MRIALISFVVAFMLICGCSGGGKNPIAPGGPVKDIALDNVPIIGLSESGESSNALGLLGAYELNVNFDELTADLVAKRVPTLAESYLVNGITYFTVKPCTDCLRISGLSLTESGNIEIVFSIKHPFQVGDPHKAPSSTNRNDLDIFDVALVFHPTDVAPANFALFKIPIYENYCVAPDGYTNELENITDDPAVCPYYLVVDDSKTGARNYNRLPQGSNMTFSAVLKPAEKLVFDLYLTFGYGASATFISRLCPRYFNPEFNRKNAWKIQAFPPEGHLPPRLGITWQENDQTTKYYVTVKVWDWQQGVTTIANPPVEPYDIAFASNVKRVSVEIPGMTNELPFSEIADSGSGSDPRFPLIFHVPIANENLLPPGEYLSLVRVADERIPPSGGGPGKIDALVNVPNTGGFEWYDIPEFAAYTTFIATVVSEPCTATGSIVAPPGDDYTAFSGEIVNFKIDGDPFGQNVLTAYWADWGTGTFTESNTTGEFSHEFKDSDCPVFADDEYTVRFGLELDCTEGEIIPIDTILIKMSCPPCNAVGSVLTPVETEIDVMNGQTLEFTMESTPTGGNVVAYWADWGTGTYTESSPTPSFSHQFTSDDCPNFSDPPPDIGNTTLKINRVYLSFGISISPITPFTLSWDNTSGTPDNTFTVKFGVELDCWPGNINHIGTRTINITSCYDYEVYWDNDPTDGLMNNMEFLETIKTPYWNAPPAHLDVNGSHYVEGITYAVYSKNCLGVRSTNPSEPAHIMVFGAETLNVNEAYNAEGWSVNNASGYSDSYLFAPYTAPEYAANGYRSIRFGDKVGQPAIGTWEGISRMTPTVPNSSIRFLEFSMFKYDPG